MAPMRTSTLLLALLCAGCAAVSPRSPAQHAADDAVTRQVEAALEADPTLFARHIDVSAEGGVVYLGGYVWTPEDLYSARRIAAAVPGVVAVDSQMELLRGGSKGR